VRADVGDRATREQGDSVGEEHRRRAVGHDDAGHAAQHALQRCLHQCLGVDVERGEGVVEHEHRWSGEHRPGQGEPLPLPA